MLTFASIGKRFPGTTALRDISFEIVPGEIHALVGENGAGKSTLMNIVSGVYTDYDGQLLLNGEPVRFSGPRDAQDHGIATIHQELNLIPQLTVAENIMLGREVTVGPGLIRSRPMLDATRELLTALGIPISPNRRVGTLRIAEQQLVEIAKALSLQANILILDEPTSALSDTEINNLFHILLTLKAQGMTMIYISHKFGEIFRLADRVTVLRDGQFVSTVPVVETSERHLINLMVGRPLQDLFPKTSAPGDDDVLVIDGLSFQPNDDADRRSLHDITFSLKHGEILGLAGLMGSGRTELLEAIYGEKTHGRSTGRRVLGGKPLPTSGPRGSIARGITFVPEDRKREGLFMNLNISSNLLISAMKSISTTGVIRLLRERRMASRFVSELQVRTSGLGRLVSTLSGGNQQKVVIGKCLATAPQVLLLDEPTRGVDVGAKAEIYHLMNDISRTGAGIIMASSELPELLAMCDRILVLHEGRMAALLSRGEATQEHIMAAATGHAMDDAA